MLAMLLHSLPGTPFVYQGEEIGMTNMRFPHIEDYNDPDAKNTYHQHILAGDTPDVALKEAQMISRDNARTPMQWNATENAGFTTGKPWLRHQSELHKDQRGKPEKRPALHFQLLQSAHRTAQKQSRALTRRPRNSGNRLRYAVRPKAQL